MDWESRENIQELMQEVQEATSSDGTEIKIILFLLKLRKEVYYGYVRYCGNAISTRGII